MYRSYSVNNMPQPILPTTEAERHTEISIQKPHSAKPFFRFSDLKSDDIIILLIILMLILNECDDTLLLLALLYIFFSDYGKNKPKNPTE